MNADQCIALVGVPYLDNGETLEGFNCAGLLRYCQREYFGREIPSLPIGDAIASRQAFKDGLESDLWAETTKPQHGDGALLRGGDNPHVGIYLEFDGGGILHALEDVGVIYTTLDQLRLFGFSRTKYYRIKDNAGKPCNSSRPVSPES